MSCPCRINDRDNRVLFTIAPISLNFGICFRPQIPKNNVRIFDPLRLKITFKIKLKNFNHLQLFIQFSTFLPCRSALGIHFIFEFPALPYKNDKITKNGYFTKLIWNLIKFISFIMFLANNLVLSICFTDRLLILANIENKVNHFGISSDYLVILAKSVATASMLCG